MTQRKQIQLVNEQSGDKPLERLRNQLRDFAQALIEALVDRADGRDAAKPCRSSVIAFTLASRHALHIHLHQRRYQRLLAALEALELQCETCHIICVTPLG